MSVGGPLGFALLEQSSPGLFPATEADLARLFTLRSSGATRQTTLLSLARDAVRLQREADRRGPAFLLAPEDARVLSEAGFEVVGERVEVLASRDGATRVVNCLNLLS